MDRFTRQYGRREESHHARLASTRDKIFRRHRPVGDPTTVMPPEQWGNAAALRQRRQGDTVVGFDQR